MAIITKNPKKNTSFLKGVGQIHKFIGHDEILAGIIAGLADLAGQIHLWLLFSQKWNQTKW
jgi:hypothetical protein